MTALIKQLDLPQAASRIPQCANDWLPIAEVARRLDMTPRHVRRLCADKWERVALAVQEGGEWLIHIGADPRLATALPASDLLIREDFMALPPAQQTMAMKRAECVRTFRRWKCERAEAVNIWLPALLTDLTKFYPDLPGVSQRSLYRWDKKAGHPIDVAELIDWRGWSASEQGGAGSPEAWQFFAKQYLDPNKPTLADCWRHTQMWAGERGIDWCSVHSCKRQLDQRITPEQQAYHRRPAEWRSKYSTYIQQHPERHAGGDCWVADHRPLDIFCRFEGQTYRPVLTRWQDWRTRKTVGWELSVTPNTDTILAAFGMAVRDPANLGPPRLVWMDNGKDFDCYALKGASKKDRQRGKMRISVDEDYFKGVFGAFGVEPHFSLSKTPTGKARCERSFATDAMQFDKRWATYSGKDTTHKPEWTIGGRAITLDQRMRKQPGIIPDFADVKRVLAEHIERCNNNADHAIDDLRDPRTQQRLSPADAYAAWKVPSVLADPAALALCLMPHTRPVTVGKQGVRVQLPGCPARYYGQFETSLRPFKGTGRKVYVAYDPSDTRHVQVRDDKLRLVCVASVNGDTGVYGAPESREALKSMMRDRSQYNRSLKVVKARPAMQYIPDNMLIAEHAAKQVAQRAPTTLRPDPDQPMRLIQTPFDGQSNELRSQSMRPRKVAGAESMSDELPDIPGAMIAPPPIASGMDDDDDIAPPSLGAMSLEDDV